MSQPTGLCRLTAAVLLWPALATAEQPSRPAAADWLERLAAEAPDVVATLVRSEDGRSVHVQIWRSEDGPPAEVELANVPEHDELGARFSRDGESLFVFVGQSKTYRVRLGAKVTVDGKNASEWESVPPSVLTPSGQTLGSERECPIDVVSPIGRFVQAARCLGEAEMQMTLVDKQQNARLKVSSLQWTPELSPQPLRDSELDWLSPSLWSHWSSDGTTWIVRDSNIWFGSLVFAYNVARSSLVRLPEALERRLRAKIEGPPRDVQCREGWRKQAPGLHDVMLAGSSLFAVLHDGVYRYDWDGAREPELVMECPPCGADPCAAFYLATPGGVYLRELGDERSRLLHVPSGGGKVRRYPPGSIYLSFVYSPGAEKLRARYSQSMASNASAMGDYRKKDYAAAARGFDAALESFPSNPVALYNRACVAALLGDVDGAVARLEAYARMDAGWRERVQRDADFEGIRRAPQLVRLLGVGGDSGSGTSPAR